MKNAVTNKKKININDLIIYIGFGVITLFAVVFTLVVCAKPFKITKIDNIKEVDYSDYATQSPSEYYVYVYVNDVPRASWYEKIVIEYANYARLNSATPIYAYDYYSGQNKQIASSIATTVTVGENVPCLIKIKNGKVDSKYTTWTKFNNELTKAMNKQNDDF